MVCGQNCSTVGRPNIPTTPYLPLRAGPTSRDPRPSVTPDALTGFDNSAPEVFRCLGALAGLGPQLCPLLLPITLPCARGLPRHCHPRTSGEQLLSCVERGGAQPPVTVTHRVTSSHQHKPQTLSYKIQERGRGKKCPRPVLSHAGVHFQGRKRAEGVNRSKLEREVSSQEKLPPEDRGLEPGSRLHLSKRPALGKQCPQLCKRRGHVLNMHPGCKCFCER